MKKTKNITYKNDPLLLDNKIFVDGMLNIYGCLFKKEDMQNNKKGRVLKVCPYVFDENNDILDLVKRVNDNINFLNLRKSLGRYLNIGIIEKGTLLSWFERKIFPFPFVRVVSLINEKDTLSLINGKKITNFFKQSRIKFPYMYEDVRSDFLTYFVGLHFGDGTMNKIRWKMVDGDETVKNLEYSLEFVKKIKNKLSKIFETGPKIYEPSNKNCYELLIGNKWFCRYLNFVYGIEYNKKQDPKIPSILRDKETLVLRGLFDTDGSIKDCRFLFGTKYIGLYRKVLSIIDTLKISYKEKINNIERKSPVYILEVKREDIIKLINHIGISHPRKVKEVEKYLLSTSCSRRFYKYNSHYIPKIPKHEFIELCKLIRPIKNSGKIRLISDFYRLNKNKQMRIINNLNLNFDVSKFPDKHGVINSYKIERVLTNYCVYKNNRSPLNVNYVNEIIKNLNGIWVS